MIRLLLFIAFFVGTVLVALGVVRDHLPKHQRVLLLIGGSVLIVSVLAILAATFYALSQFDMPRLK